jgi:hypothetical protein
LGQVIFVSSIVLLLKGPEGCGNVTSAIIQS